MQFPFVMTLGSTEPYRSELVVVRCASVPDDLDNVESRACYLDLFSVHETEAVIGESGFYDEPNGLLRDVSW